MHVVFLIGDLDKSSGGPSRSVTALADGLAAKEQVTRVTVFYRSSADMIDLPNNSKLFFVPKTVSNIRKLLVELHTDHPISVMHVQGLWTLDLHRSVVFARRHGIPYFISPRGMLSPWCLNFKKWRKRAALMIYQANDLRNASALVATSSAEQSEILEVTEHKRVIHIPNGCPVDSRTWTGELSSKQIIALRNGYPRRVVTMGRLHPVKQFDRLITAWARRPRSGFVLELAGPDRLGYSDQLAKLALQLGVSDSV